MEIISINYGNSYFSEDNIFVNGDKDKLLPIVFKIFVVKDNQKTILIDAGCETMPGLKMHNFPGSVNALERNGILAKDITDVAITHSHHDHIECVKYFENATVHIQKDEYEDGKKYIPEKFDVNVFENDFNITENVVIKKIGGHSIGSCIVEVYNRDKMIVIAGDESYSRRNIQEKILPGRPYCPENSKGFIEKYSSIKYNVLLSHDE